jgi:23S rRNA (adenine2503-C2)-methyltransferase
VRFNLVLMGMGEPLHNYDETMKALRILNDEDGFAISPRRITLSTVGLLPALEKLAREPIMPNLAISLHAPTDEQRGALVPINRKYGVSEIIEACKRFPLKRRSRITFEYVMLAGINDRPEDARRLAKLLDGREVEGESHPAERRGRHSLRAAVGRSRSVDSRRFLPRGISPSPFARAAAGHSCGLRSADRRGREASAAQQLAATL